MGRVLEIITGTNDGNTTVSAARWGCLIVGVGSLVIGSKIARERQAKGQSSIAGILF